MAEQSEHAKEERQTETSAKQGPVDRNLSWCVIVLCVLGAIFSLYIFLVGLSLMGSSFKVLGGRGASNMFSGVDNPIAGLMTGVLATVLVQSSSTSTSIVVAMVGADSLTVKAAIPIIMGSNIGTSVTNTIVSLGQSGNRIELERAFAGATVHDAFNMLTVLTLLPLEAITAGIQGEGGILFWFTHAMTKGMMGGSKGEALFTSPIKLITAPFADAILKANKYVIYALTLPPPQPVTPTVVNTTLCASRRLSGGKMVGEEPTLGARALLSRRLGDKPDCTAYYCVGSDLDKNFKKISSKSYEKLKSCTDHILDKEGKPCGKDKCYLDAGEYYQAAVTEGRLLKDGFLKDAGDEGGGIIGLIFSILLLCAGLIGLVTLLKLIFLSKANSALKYATRLNDYLALLVGIGITIIVQSSSVTTSALTPLCGLGVLPLAKMLPMTLGANIGTTCTALIASLVSLKFNAVQIALCHLFFNIAGILIWFPVPAMRKLPLGAAELLGLYASYYRFFPVLYILVAFVCIPGICLGVSVLYDASVAGGVVVTILLIALVGLFVFLWWFGYPGEQPLCYRILSKEQRAEGVAALAVANAALTGQTLAPAELEEGTVEQPHQDHQQQQSVDV